MRSMALGLVLAATCGLAFGDTITLKDGTVVSGRIVMQTEDTVIIKTADGQTKSIPRVNIAKTVKTGAGTKLSRRSYDCRTCYDSGKSKCADCDGSGKASGEKCPDCKGFGRSACNACNSTGFTDCNRCGGDGRIYVAGHYETTLTGVRTRYVSGREENCTACGGKGKAVCLACKSKGKTSCATCNGVGRKLVRGKCETCEGTGKAACPDCAGGGATDSGPAIPSGPVLNEADRERRIAQIEAQIKVLQAELQKLKYKDPSPMALKMYMGMSDEDRAKVKDIRDKLRGPKGYEYYCRMPQEDETMLKRSLLLQEVLDELGFKMRRAREELQ